MRAEIISVGTELLLGDIVNTNAQYLARELAGLGYTVYYQTVVGDNPVRLRSLVLQAKERSDILLVSGGLGPTDDDLTKETVAAAFGDTLVPDADILAGIEAYFAGQGREMTDNNRKQAQVPRNGGVLPNANGTAPGVFFRQGDKFAFLMPGPPLEMQPMFEDHVKPVLLRMQDAAIRSLTLRVFGVGESDLETRVMDLLEGSNPTAALYAKTGEVHIRITARAQSAEQADMMCAEYAELFRAVLGDVIYSESGEELEGAVVRVLAENRESLATAESCTGGMLAERLTAVPGASGVFGFGAVTYSNRMKRALLGVKTATLRRYGAVSSQVAAEMAAGAAKRGNADYGVGITGIAGPDGGTAEKPVGLVYVAAWAKSRVYIKKLQILGRPREFVRRMATQHALDMVRRLALGLPLPGAKMFTGGQHPDFERQSAPKRKGGGAARGLLAFLAVGVALALVLVLLNQFGVLRQNKPQQTGLAELAGLAYGSPEFERAALQLVAEKQADDAAVRGLIALPDGLQCMVVTTGLAQKDMEPVDEWPGLGAAANIAPGSDPAAPGSHTLILGGSSLQALLAYAGGESAADAAAPPATFRYFTDSASWTCKLYGVYLLDAAEQPADGFDPLAAALTGYENYLDFVLGARMRSLYDVPVSIEEGDSFFSLAAEDPARPGWRVYLCGRLLRQGESAQDAPAAATAGAPLMPAAWYREQNLPLPNAEELHAFWLRWYFWRDSSNDALQLAVGAPAADLALAAPLPEEGGADGAEAGADADASGPGEADSAVLSAAPAGSAAPDAGEGEAPGVSSAGEGEEAGAPPEGFDAAMLTVHMNGERISESTTQVLAMICQWEAGALEPAAIQALAVAAHSWLRNQQAAGNAAPAVLGLPPSPRVLEAVAPVTGLILTPDAPAGQAEASAADAAAPGGVSSRAAFTPFCRMAAGGTNAPAAVWGETAARSYLPEVPSPHDQNRADWRYTATVPADEMEGILRRHFSVEEAGEPEGWFAEVEKDENGYVLAITAGGVEMSGTGLWRALAEDGILRSPAFDVGYDGASFVFTSYGAGHGCGLSVAGAQGYARQGWGPERILAHYYPGTQLARLA